MGAPELDIRTLLALVSVVGVVNALAWLRWSFRQDEFAGLAFFAVANAALALGMYLVSMRGVLPELMTTVVANLVTLTGLLLNHEGLRRFAGARWSPWRSPLWLLLPLALGSAWFTFVDPSVQARVLVFTGCTVIGCAWISIDLLMSREARASQLRAAALVFGGFAILQAGRWLLTVGHGPLEDFMTAGQLHAMVLIAYICFLLLKDLAIFDATVARLIAESSRLAHTDALTGLANRREALARGAKLFNKARRRSGSLTAVMVDVDHFKTINDCHGHATGDAVLVKIAALLAAATPPQGLCARLGGEEFVLLLPDTKLAAGAALAEDLRRDLEVMDWPGLPIARASASFGVAALGLSPNLDHLIARADRALLAAKADGRNRVIIDAAATANHGEQLPTQSAVNER